MATGATAPADEQDVDEVTAAGASARAAQQRAVAHESIVDRRWHGGRASTVCEPKGTVALHEGQSGVAADQSLGDLRALFAPRSVAVVGASGEPGNVGGAALGYLTRFGYPGKMWAVNPKRTDVDGVPCFPSIGKLPDVPDLVIFAVRAALVPELVRSAAESGARFGIVWAGGFAESGDSGRELERRLVAACHQTGFRVIGPNCIGLINSDPPVPATFASFLKESDNLLPGDISMVSQSGGLGTQAQSEAQGAGFGFRYMVSSGNEAVLTCADFVSAFVDDDGTRVVAAYLEGTRDGAALTGALTRARAARKPVVMLKGGTAPASARAATAHTGALVGHDKVWQAVLDELGVIRVDSLQDLLDVSLFLSSTDLAKLPRGSGLAIVTFGGGGGVLAADQAVRAGLHVPELSEGTRERLAPLLPSIASTHNPVDATPQTYNDPRYLERFAEALCTVADDPSIHMLLALFGPMANGVPEVVQALAEVRDRSGKTICVAWPSAPRAATELMRERRFMVFGEPARAVRTLSKIVAHDEPTPVSRCVGSWTVSGWPAVADIPSGGVISEAGCYGLLEAAGLPTAPHEMVRERSQVADAIRRLSTPVAMKGVSDEVSHRATAGLVTLDVQSARQALTAYDGLVARAETLGVGLDGVLVQQMVPGGIEMLVSAFVDPTFGLIVSCGAGGVFTEAVDDVALSRGPVDEQAATRLLGRLRMVKYVQGTGRRTNLGQLAQFVARFSQLAASAPWERFMFEVNPVMWTPDGATAVDGLLVVG